MTIKCHNLMFVGCDANSKTRKRINVQCNAGLCWFSTHDTALTFPNIKTIISCIQMWDWVKIHYFCWTTYYSHWSLLNKVYHKLENYFQCAYKIVAAILHQCKRKTCCILQISLKKIFFIFFLWIMFQIDGLPIQERKNQLSYFLFWREKFWQTYSQTSNLFST